MASGKTYIRNAANDGWIIMAQGSGGGSGDYEPALGNPAANDYVLASQTDGTRSWVVQSGSGSFDTNFSIKMSAPKSVATVTTTKIDTFDTIVIDSNSEWDAGNLRWLCATTGTYIINAVLIWDTGAVGYRGIYIYVDGAAVQNRAVLNSGSSLNTMDPITHKISLTAGQYVEIYGRHNQGSSLNAIVGSPAAEWQIWRIN